MEKLRLYGFKEFSKEEAPNAETLPNGKIIKTYFVRAKELSTAWAKLAEYLGKTIEMVEEAYGLCYVNLSSKQFYRIPWNRRKFIK